MTQPAAVRVVVSPLRGDEYIAACRRLLRKRPAKLPSETIGKSKPFSRYLRSPMTKQCIKILIKADSMNESVLP